MGVAQCRPVGGIQSGHGTHHDFKASRRTIHPRNRSNASVVGGRTARRTAPDNCAGGYRRGCGVSRDADALSSERDRAPDFAHHVSTKVTCFQCDPPFRIPLSPPVCPHRGGVRSSVWRCVSEELSHLCATYHAALRTLISTRRPAAESRVTSVSIENRCNLPRMRSEIRG